MEIRKNEEQVPKQAWEAPELIELGHVAEVIRGGAGKASAATEDSGDAGKPSGLE